jgi:CheY-like chemotaxis protein
MPTLERALSPVGLNVFVVEDEALVALNLEDMLADIGCRVLGPAMRLNAALEMVREGLDADIAILDVNIAGHPVYPLAEALRDRGMPIVFATGYGRSGLPDIWQDCPVLQKPYTTDDVLASIRRALERDPAA